jgi:hypothetical protein
VRTFEGKLDAHGVTASGPVLRHRRLVWTALASNGIAADRLEMALDWRRARVSGLRIDLAAAPMRALASARKGGGGSSSMRVEVTDLTVSLRDTVLVSGWHGTLRPLDLEGAEGWLRASGAGIDLHVTRSFDLGFAGGEIALDVDPATSEAHAVVRSPWVRHELLGREAVHVADADLRLDPTAHVEGRWGGAEVSADLSPIFDPKNGPARISVRGLPFVELVAWFADRIPEARRATVDGTIGVTAEVAVDPLAWRVSGEAAGLRASHVLSDPDSLRGGRFHWQVRTASGGVRTLTPRPWTTLERADWLGPAVVAAEDARFYSHDGYDVEQVNDALATWADEGGTLRGGSTITQQLAKNLYTGDERTLVRKLRELLYALDIEGTLSKERILETYLNVVELGPDVHGVANASQLYFLKDPMALTPKEAAFVASLLPAPKKGYEAALRGKAPAARIDAILENMKDGGTLSAVDLARAKAAPLRILAAP